MGVVRTFCVNLSFLTVDRIVRKLFKMNGGDLGLDIDCVTMCIVCCRVTIESTDDEGAEEGVAGGMRYRGAASDLMNGGRVGQLYRIIE